MVGWRAGVLVAARSDDHCRRAERREIQSRRRDLAVPQETAPGRAPSHHFESIMRMLILIASAKSIALRTA